MPFCVCNFVQIPRFRTDLHSPLGASTFEEIGKVYQHPQETKLSNPTGISTCCKFWPGEMSIFCNQSLWVVMQVLRT